MSGIDSAWDEKWSEWIDWGGGECPVQDGALIQWKGRHAVKSGSPVVNAASVYWEHLGDPMDIIAYRYKIKEQESDMHPDLKWLAENVSEWESDEYGCVQRHSGAAEFLYGSPLKYDDLGSTCFSRAQWQAARQQLGLDQPEVTEAEEEAWQAKERELIGKRNKYQREIKPGIWVDVYDVLQAWAVSNPALQHLIKKALQPGQRGHKNKCQDMDDIVASALRAKELESE